MALQVNRIRKSLAVMAQNSTAFGLRQPHLKRTRLCQLSDTELDPVYVEQRTKLRSLVFSLARPKVCPLPCSHALPCILNLIVVHRTSPFAGLSTGLIHACCPVDVAP